MKNFTIKELYLLCSQISDYTEFVVYEGFFNYTFEEDPIEVNCFDDLSPEITMKTVLHFSIEEDGARVRVEVEE